MKFRHFSVLDILKMIVGSAMAAAAFQFFTFPNSIVSGGVTGISQILNNLIGTPVGLGIITINPKHSKWTRV